MPSSPSSTEKEGLADEAFRGPASRPEPGGYGGHELGLPAKHDSDIIEGQHVPQDGGRRDAACIGRGPKNVIDERVGVGEPGRLSTGRGPV